MGSTRALFASIGVSVSLIAAAALSLFTISVVIAFGGWSAGLGETPQPTALVFGGSDTIQAKSVARLARTEPVVLRRPAQRAPQRAAAPARVAPKADGSEVRIVRRPTIGASPASQQQPDAQPPAARPAPAPAHTTPTGDAVRRVGDGLSSAAQNTGKALGEITAPLGPPVSAAVQQLLDLVAAALQRATNSLGGTLDKLGR